MIWDKSYNTHTDEQLKQILEQHKLWLDTGGKEGKKANLSGAVLIKTNLAQVNLAQANLEQVKLGGADLWQANFEKANLQEASLIHTDLTEANLKGANLKIANLANSDLSGTDFTQADLSEANLGRTLIWRTIFLKTNLQETDFSEARISQTNFENAINLSRARKVLLSYSTNSTLQQPTELQEKQNRIQQLEQELQQTKQKAKEGKENTEQTQKLQDELSQVKQERDNLEKQLKATLDTHIKNAQEALAKSLDGADKRIEKYSKNARNIGWGAISLIALDVIVILYLGFHYEMFFNLLKEKEIGAWALTLYSFPILIVFSIAVTLLRHQKKLLDEVRHYSSEKRQIELYSGLLKASQYSAKSLNDPEQSAKYVHETFDKIRDRILSEQPHANTAGSAVEKEEYSSSLEPLIKVISDMIAKSEVKK